MNALTRFVFWVLGILAALCVILYVGVFDVWVIPSDDPQFSASIAPTLFSGDLVLISRHGPPERPNLVRCTDPDAPGRFVVARLIGIGREKYDVAEGVTINDQHIASPRACLVPRMTINNPATGEDEVLNCTTQEFAGTTFDALYYPGHAEQHKAGEVPPGKVYLVSDNRHIHLDSRDFNAVDPETCKRIPMRVWGHNGWNDSDHRLTYIP
jgi:signal peptidase I